MGKVISKFWRKVIRAVIEIVLNLLKDKTKQ